jgi:hypothetical protein
MRRWFADAKSTSVLEDLSNGQLGEDSHGEHHRKDDSVGQGAFSGIDPSGGLKCLLDRFGWDNLFQSRQSIEDPPRLIGRQGALDSVHQRHSLLGALLVGKPKVTGGCDVRLFQGGKDGPSPIRKISPFCVSSLILA